MKTYNILVHRDNVVHRVEVVTLSRGSLCYDRELMTADEFNESILLKDIEVINVYHGIDMAIADWLVIDQIETDHSLENIERYNFDGKSVPIRKFTYNKVEDTIDIYLDHCISIKDDKEEMQKVDNVIRKYKELLEDNTGWLSKLYNYVFSK